MRKQSIKFRSVRMTNQASTAQIVSLSLCVFLCDVMMLVCVYVLYYRRQHQNGAWADAAAAAERTPFTKITKCERRNHVFI